MCVSDLVQSMTLIMILPQAKFETISSKDVGGDIFLVQADKFYPVVLMDLNFGIPVKRPFQKCLLLPP